MFLYFHRKYNMILFVLEIFDYIQIKTLFSFLLYFSPTLTFTCYQSPKFNIKQTIQHTNKIT
jgi:hypothetical protein